MLLPGLRLPRSMLLSVIRVPGRMLHPGIDSPRGAYSRVIDSSGVCSYRESNQTFQTHFLSVNLKKIDSPGGAYSRGIDLPGVFSSRESDSPGGAYSRDWLPGKSYSRESDSPGEAYYGNQTPREEHTPGKSTPREYAPTGDLWILPGVTLKLTPFSKTNNSPKVIKQGKFSFYVFVC